MGPLTPIPIMDTIYDLIEEAKLRFLWWALCIFAISYFLTRKSFQFHFIHVVFYVYYPISCLYQCFFFFLHLVFFYLGFALKTAKFESSFGTCNFDISFILQILNIWLIFAILLSWL